MFRQQQFCISLSYSSKLEEYPQTWCHTCPCCLFACYVDLIIEAVHSHTGASLLQRFSGCFFSPGHGFFWGEDSSRIAAWNPNKGVWISCLQLDTHLGPCEDKGPKLLEHAPEIFKRVSKQYRDMLKCVHIYRKTWGCCWIILTPTAPDFAGDLDVPFAGWHGARLEHPHGGTEPLPMRPLCARRCVAMGGVFLGPAWARRQVTAWWFHVFESYGIMVIQSD